MAKTFTARAFTAWLVVPAAIGACLVTGTAFAQAKQGSSGGQAVRSAPPPQEPVPTAHHQPSGIPEDRAYHINPGDDIEVYVWGDERLQRDLKVLPDGSFAFPLVGTVRAAGRTPTQVEDELENRLASQYKGEPPQVTVSVKSPSGLTISVVGKVRSPGTFSPGRNINLLEALALAGGPSDFADVNNVVVLRNHDGTTSVINGNLNAVLKGKPSQHDLSAGGIPMLQSGDTVIVP